MPDDVPILRVHAREPPPGTSKENPGLLLFGALAALRLAALSRRRE